MRKILVLAIVLTGSFGAFGILAVHAQNNLFPYTQNTAYGDDALHVNKNGYGNSAFGGGALLTNDNGSMNSALGTSALLSNTEGNSNTAAGYEALLFNTTGSNNSALGDGALFNVTTGIANIGLGSFSGGGTTTGSYNISIGGGTGIPGNGNYNIEIGNTGFSGDRGVIRIGTLANQGRFYAAGIYGIQITDAVPLYTNRDGQVGTVLSSIRFKEDVHDMASASDKLFQLRPVTYRYKQANEDGTKPVDYGLIAEEVAQVYPDMVARDTNGQVVTVQYQKLTPMLLNEVQKLHRQLEMQQETIEKLEVQQEPLETLGQRLSALESATASANSKN